MDRNAEYNELMAELSDPPLKLDYTVDRARPRYQKWKKRRFIRRAFGIPLGTVAAVCAAFVVLVNASPAFAAAAERVPWLSEITNSVMFTPSVRRAAQAGAVQKLNQTQTKNGITANVGYAFSDKQQINLYYILSADSGEDLLAYPALLDANGKDTLPVSGTSASLGAASGAPRHFSSTISDYMQPPEKVRLVLAVYRKGEKWDPASTADPRETAEPDATFTFDVALTNTVETQQLSLGDGAAFAVDGQKLAVTEVSISPTEMRFKIHAAGENTAWLESLLFYFENENGERFSSGHATQWSWHSSSGEGDINFASEDSPYYASGEHLTLCVTGAVWMAKDRSEKDGKGKPVHIDLANKTADFLPEGVAFESAERTRNGWQLRFSGPKINNIMYSIWSSTPCDANGLDINPGQPTESSGVGLDNSRVLETLPIENYTTNEVWLRPNFTSYTALDKPVKIKLK